ncbi:hypothetical protein GJW-30_1_01998 [Variibacter gotjawalensis]|uniref:HTH marR-type domain-containing protein n=1 Tax=Variibacter gotjawalensis TaxID=1333996 RepID=A0A0S3PU47_9BRAD|nr:hypothetical protein [Variibacter gotjawalensis]NIK49788.1 DNA-binding MarR family transcriptional regulator [Variibacter gotjawalensis]BAT59465.1 hypothetical protein GJW-30_1_01998 [Variibacter gotjawalensis]
MKTADHSDGRAWKLGLTAKGDRLCAQLSDDLRAVNDRLFSGLSRSEMALVMRMFEKILTEGRTLISEGVD